MLWTFTDFPVDSQEVGALLLVVLCQAAYLHSFEAEIIIIEIFIVDDCRIKFFCMCHDNIVSLFRDHRTWFVVFGIDIGIQILDDLRELLLGLLVQVRHSNTILSAE